MELTVECQKREEGSKPNALRRSGKIPANLYGHKGVESISLAVDAKTVERLLKKASVNNTLIDLNITDIPWRGQTLLREVQTHPAKGSVYHLSFFAVAAHGDLNVEVPLHFVGDAPGVKLEGGAVDTAITKIEVQCAPERIPEFIEVNISQMNMGDVMYIRDLPLPQGVTPLADAEQVVVSILAPQITPEIMEAQEAAADAELAGTARSEAEQKEPKTEAEAG